MKARESREDLLGRLPLLRAGLVTLLVLVASSYGLVQVVRGAHYRELAENNRLRKLKMKAPRGLIYDRQGRLLVENVPSYNLLLDRSRSSDLNASLDFAAKILARSRVDIDAVVERYRDTPTFKQVLIAEDLSLSEVARFGVAALEHPEFEIEVDHLRLYRHGHQTAHVMGYLGEVSTEDLSQPANGFSSGDLRGKKGVEETFDQLLRGTDGERVVVVDSHGRLMDEYGRIPPHPGQNLQLTLDLSLQQVAARYFDDKVGAAVGLDPATGEILALVSAPSFNPNRFARRLDRSEWQELIDNPHHPLQNRAIQNTYSPGSVFKVVMALAGLTEGAVGEQGRVFCSGSSRIYNRSFRCWKRGGHGWVDLHRAIKESCDVYFYQLGKLLGISRIASYARLLHLGRTTGIDIAGEKAGLVPDAEWSRRSRGVPWYPGETISVAIGQGPLLATPLQIAVIMAAVANGGQLVTPHLVGSGHPRARQPLDLGEGELQAVRQALWAVVNDRGTGAVARVPGIEVAGKTGTVQVVQQRSWIDSSELPFEQRDHAWFASFASVDGGPELVVVVFVEHGGRGSRAAAPLAKQMYETYYADHLERHQPS